MTIKKFYVSAAACRLWLLLLAVAVIVLDRITKWLVVKRVELGNAITVIPHVFRISHVENTGAAFSLFEESGTPAHVRFALLAFSLVAAIVVLFLLLKLGRKINAASIALALILGGALGNAYDRWRYGFVIDFLEVHIVHYHWPDFNVADSAIVIGGLLLLIDALWGQGSGSHGAGIKDHGSGISSLKRL